MTVNAIAPSSAIDQWLEEIKLELVAELFLGLDMARAGYFGDMLDNAMDGASWALPGSPLRFSELSRAAQAAILRAALMPYKSSRATQATARSILRERERALQGWEATEARSRSLAYLVTYSGVTAAELRDAPQGFMGGNLRKLMRQDSEELVDALIATFRDPASDTTARLAALDAVHFLGEGPLPPARLWRRVERQLLAQLFAWPLLVFGDGDAATATSLPVAIDLLPTQTSRVRLKGIDSAFLSSAAWHPMLDVARRRAWKLWRAKHGNYGNYRRVLELTDVQVDFSFASRVLSILDGSDLQGIELDGGSALPYLIQVILGRFLGQAFPSATVVTGLLGAEILGKDGDVIDWQLRAPGAFGQKLRWARRNDAIARVVIPAGDADEETRLRAMASSMGSEADCQGVDVEQWTTWEQRVEMPSARSMSDVADITQLRGWRQYRYIRTPDIRWALHSAREARRALNPGSPDVMTFMDSLAKADSTVCRTQSAPLVVASALWHINAVRRESLGGDRPAPSLSWAFVRTNGLADEDLWELVWNACEGDADSLRAMRQAPNATVAAHALAEVLNRLDPVQEGSNHRAPDLLVLIVPRPGGPDARRDTPLRELGPPIVAPQGVVDALTQHELLTWSGDPRILPLIGKTRIILCTEPAERSTRRLEDLAVGDAELMRAMRVFEYGVAEPVATSYLARVLPHLLRQSLRDRLRELSTGPDAPLRLSQGMYHIRAQWIASGDERDYEMGAFHLAAAELLCPIIALGATMPLGMDRAMSLERLLEACDHLDRAQDIVGPYDLDTSPVLRDTYNNARRAKTWMYTTLLPPNWSTMQRAARLGTSPEASARVAMRLLDGVDHVPTYRLTVAARLAARAHRQVCRVDTRSADDAGVFLQMARDLFEMAWSQVRNGGADPRFVAHVGSNFAEFLTDEAGDHAAAAAVGQLALGASRQALAQHDDLNGAVSYRWLAALGDTERNDRKSIPKYRMASMIATDAIDFLLGGLGAAVSAGEAREADWFRRRLVLRHDDEIAGARYRVRYLDKAQRNAIGPTRRRAGLKALPAPLS